MPLYTGVFVHVRKSRAIIEKPTKRKSSNVLIWSQRLLAGEEMRFFCSLNSNIALAWVRDWNYALSIHQQKLSNKQPKCQQPKERKRERERDRKK